MIASTHWSVSCARADRAGSVDNRALTPFRFAQTIAGCIWSGKIVLACRSEVKVVSEAREGNEEKAHRKAASISCDEIGAGVASVVYSCERMLPFILAYATVARRKLLVSCVVQPGFASQLSSLRQPDTVEMEVGHSTITTGRMEGAAFHIHSPKAANGMP
jgi:hypothetical protein